jgi:hypothetical protein
MKGLVCRLKVLVVEWIDPSPGLYLGRSEISRVDSLMRTT